MKISPSLIAAPLYHTYRAICASLRFTEHNREQVDAMDSAGERLVFCLWHDELFPLMHVQRQLNIVTVVSASRDGEILANLLERLGLHTVRGSSGRGGVKALLNASRMMKKDNMHACVTVDGPQGPRHQAKEGVFFLSHHADAYIAPIRIQIRPAIKAGSWDKFQVPLPFGSVHIFHGTPWKVQAQELDQETLAASRQRLEQDFNTLLPEK